MIQPDRDWQHPWLRVSLLVRSILGTQWDTATWGRSGSKSRRRWR